jgi:hypothetical protein
VAVRPAETAIETYRTDSEGEYSGATAADLRAIEPILNDADQTVVSAIADEFELEVVSSTGNRFRITRQAGGTTILSCDVPHVAGCPSSGFWG